MVHDATRPRMRTIHKPCKACRTPVPFHVWRGFREIARHLASPCPGCHCVSVLDGADSWHKSHESAIRTPLVRSNLSTGG